MTFTQSELAFPPVRSNRYPEVAPSGILVRIHKSSCSSHTKGQYPRVLTLWKDGVATPADHDSLGVLCVNEHMLVFVEDARRRSCD